MKIKDSYFAYCNLIDDYILSSDKFVFPFIIKEKTKERQIITYNSSSQFGESLRKLHEKIADDFQLNFCDRNPYSYAYHKNVRTLDALNDHLKSKHFIKIDIHHFFENISEELFFDKYGDRFNSKWRKLLSSCFYKNSLSIGFVTSPIISDYFMSNIDNAIVKYLGSHKKLHYSRYSDDILISSEEENNNSLEDLFNYIKELLSEYKLELNDKKTSRISLDYDEHNSISFLGLSISRLDENTNKITISKKYILFLLKLIEKNNQYNNSCKGLLDEINSRVAYLYYNSFISYDRFQKKHFNKYNKYYDFVPKKPIDRKASAFTVEIPDWDKYLSDFKFKLHGKAVDQSTGSITSNDSIILEEYIGNNPNVEIPSFVDAIGDNAFSNKTIKTLKMTNRIKHIGVGSFNNCSLEEIVLSDKLRAIGSNAFSNTSNLKEINIPSKIKKIQDNTFSRSGIKTIELPEELKEIESRAFQYSEIESIKIPNNINKINIGVFSYCEHLKNVELPSGLTSITGHAFEHCISLKHINLPESLLTIDGFAFSGCTALEDIYIPCSVINIDPTAFSNCPNLRKIVIDKDNKVYDSREDCNAIIESNTNKIIYIAKDGFIPDSVEIIGKSLFLQTRIENIVLSKNIKEIEASAFENCYFLKNVNILSTNLVKIGADSFKNCISLKNINLPYGLKIIANSAFYNCYNLENIELPDSVTFIGDKCFKFVSKINFKIPSSIEHIGNLAFSRCYGMKNIHIPSTLENIGLHTFAGCSKTLDFISVDKNNKKYSDLNGSNCIVERKTKTLLLGCKNTILHDDIVHFGDYCFEGCDQLTDIIFTNVLETIGKYSFAGCSKLENIKFIKAFEIGECAFKNCYSLTKCELPDSLDTLGNNCFESCVNLKEIYLPNSIVHFGLYTFMNCHNLEKISFPSSYVDNFDYNIFQGCYNIKEISVSKDNLYYESIDNCLIRISSNQVVFGCSNSIIPNTVSSIGEFAFANVHNMESITIPSNVEFISSYAFYKSSIKKVVFEDNDNTLFIYEGAFEGCINLNNIYFGSRKIELIGNNIFEACTNLKDINTDDNILLIGSGCFKNCRTLENVYLGDSIKYIPNSTFENTNIKTIDLSKVEAIRKNSFKNCKNLDNVSFNNDDNDIRCSICDSAFENCVNLSYVDLSHFTNIGKKAFYNCANLESVKLCNIFANVIDASNKYPIFVDINESAFENCVKLKEIEFNHTTKIGTNAFKNIAIEKIKFNSYLITLDNFSFENCLNLKEIEIDCLKNIGINPFKGCVNIKSIKYNDSDNKQRFNVFDNALYENFKSLIFATNLTNKISDEATEICHYAFSNLDIKEIEIPNQCEIIHKGSFMDCHKLEKISFLSKIETLNDFVFQNCSSLKTINIPESVHFINNTFIGCKLNNIYIPKYVDFIAPQSFNTHNDLISIKVDPSNKVYKSINDNMLVNSKNELLLATKDAIINDGIVGIKSHAFNNLEINEIALPDSIKYIEPDSFKDSKIKKININKTISADLFNGFENCNLLEEINVDNDNPYIYSINNIILTYDNKLILSNKYSYIPDEANSLSDHCFNTNSIIENLFIPAHLTNINLEALSNLNINHINVDKDNPVYDSRNNCDAIIISDKNCLIYGCKNTNISSDIIKINKNAFNKTVGLKSIFIPKNIRSIDFNAFNELNDLASICVDKDNLSYRSNENNTLLYAINANRVLLSTKEAEVPSSIYDQFEALKPNDLNFSNTAFKLQSNTKINNNEIDDLPF